jgi:hypothetical protein
VVKKVLYLLIDHAYWILSATLYQLMK